MAMAKMMNLYNHSANYFEMEELGMFMV